MTFISGSQNVVCASEILVCIGLRNLHFKNTSDASDAVLHSEKHWPIRLSL